MEPLDYERDPQVRGPFETLALLGEGGMGRAYLARRLPLDGWDRSWETAYRMADADSAAVGEDALAVLKTIRPQLLAGLDAEKARARFVAEVDAIRTVVGPRIPAFLGASPESSEPWLAMEYVPGPSLHTQVKHGGLITAVGPWLALALGLVEAIESVHGADLLHRDLKPGNVVLGPNGPVVLDFGLAVLAERQDLGDALTKTGTSLGTPAFMPWEQYKDAKRVKASADVYAIGSTLFFTATGKSPYDGPPMPIAPDWEGVPPEFLPLLGRLLASVESQRPTLTDLRHELSALLARHGLPYEEAAQQLAEIVANAGLTPKLLAGALAAGPDPEVQQQAQRAVNHGAPPDAPWIGDDLFDELSPDADADEPGGGAHADGDDPGAPARYTPTVSDQDEQLTAPLPSPAPTKMFTTESADSSGGNGGPGAPLHPPASPAAEARRRPVTPRPVPRPALKVAERLRQRYARSGSL
ncbi:serine/threonine protein kinase [Streptomyces sp. NPDC000880]